MPTMSGPAVAALAEATQALYRGQCNCAYWHGAFGGIYLPHLRNAIYHELITADAAADRAEGRRGPWVEATTDDYDFDGRTEVRLSSDGLDGWIAPARDAMRSTRPSSLRSTRYRLTGSPSPVR
jgi:alpha-amylase